MQFIIFLISFLLLHVSHADWKETIYGVNVTVKHRSANLTISNNINSLKVSFKDIIEYGRDGITPIDPTNTLRHFFKDFEFQTFSVSMTEYITIVGTTRNISAARTNFTTTLTGTAANLTLHLIVFDNITLIPDGGEDDTYLVYDGTVKFGFTISGWPFCGQKNVEPCNNQEIGKFLDVSIIIDGAKETVSRFKFDRSRQGEGVQATTYDYGGGDVTFSHKYFKNDTWHYLPNGYPKIKDNVAVIRLPVFQLPVYYDPTVNISSTKFIRSSSSIVTRPSHLMVCVISWISWIALL